MFKKLITTAAFALLLSLNCSTAEEDMADGVELVTDADKYSYAVGSQIGAQFKEMGVVVSPHVIAQAIIDVMEEKDLQMTPTEIAEIQTKVMGELQASQNIESEQNLAAANDFLAENGTKDGVITLPSGLQYKVITEGTGASPTEADNIEANYRGTFLNGDEFDSSYGKDPLVMGVSLFIQGWIEGLQLMKEGSKWELYIHPDLGYGSAGRSGIPPNSALIFEMELLRVIKE
jgi:FKBP-type peptidyl-prolyl cis-trans isomerase